MNDKTLSYCLLLLVGSVLASIGYESGILFPGAVGRLSRMGMALMVVGGMMMITVLLVSAAEFITWLTRRFASGHLRLGHWSMAQGAWRSCGRRFRAARALRAAADPRANYASPLQRALLDALERPRLPGSKADCSASYSNLCR
jgi:hypothetical protein